jgi:alkanesulfonate monooxygenase SsuD/methylene tetrahydromethanopterin reductase-like flavin-dependent oxidoreductase (luciferase family)
MTPMLPPTRFGLFMGQVGLGWQELVERFTLADELGFDHAWLVDHLMPTDPPHDRDIFEAWTALAGLAASTRRIGLGVLVTSNTFRHPSVLAKQAVTVDHISGGRLILGIGIGWYSEEHRRFGVEMPAAPVRVERLLEAVEIIEALQRGTAATYHGEHFRIDGAHALPRPIQRPRIPILMAAHRPRMLELAAQHADIWDTFPTLEGTATEGVSSDLVARVEAFEAACRRAGRDPRSVRRSMWVGPEPLTGEDAYVEFVRVHRSIGFTDLMTGLPGREHWETVRRIAHDVIPRLRTQEAEARTESDAAAVAAAGSMRGDR